MVSIIARFSAGTSFARNVCRYVNHLLASTWHETQLPATCNATSGIDVDGFCCSRFRPASARFNHEHPTPSFVCSLLLCSLPSNGCITVSSPGKRHSAAPSTRAGENARETFLYTHIYWSMYIYIYLYIFARTHIYIHRPFKIC